MPPDHPDRPRRRPMTEAESIDMFRLGLVVPSPRNPGMCIHLPQLGPELDIRRSDPHYRGYDLEYEDAATLFDEADAIARRTGRAAGILLS